MKMKTPQLLAAALVGVLAFTSAQAQNTPGYNSKIPEKILTPDTVETRIGTLKFFDGFPTKETTERVYDNLDFLRGVEVFLNFIPATSLESMLLPVRNSGAESLRAKAMMI
jgi:hypothetical protein